MPKNATIRDVAARAALSIATVSRAITGNGAVSADSRQRVQAAIAELGFRPNTIGRSLKAARSRSVGVLVPALANPIFAESVSGVQEVAAEHGYSVLIASTDYDPAREARAIESLLSNRVEGLVLTVADGDRSRSLDTLDASGTPFVLVYNETFTSGRPFVSVDNVAGVAAIIDRMAALGHRRIAMVAGRFHQSDRSRLRHQGFRAALRAHGLAPGPVIEVDFSDLRFGAELGRIMDSASPPTALFASNDMLALATIRTLHDLGLRVPEHVSVAGFDGIDVGTLVAPSLATLVQPARLMGRRAMDLLFSGLAGGPRSSAVHLPFAVRMGESLAPPSRGVGSSRIEPPTLQPKEPTPC